jgi:hypothetical protein
MKDSLQRLRDLSPKVNKTCDEATKVVREVEKFLTDSKVTVPAEVVVQAVQVSPKKRELTTLCFGRLDSSFRIAVKREEETEFVDGRNMVDYAIKTTDETPWLECPRDLKLSTFPKLPELLKNIGEEVEKSLKNAEDAMPEIEKVLASLK